MQAVAVRIMQGSVLGCSTWFLIRHALTYADLRDRTAPDMSALPKTTLTATEYLAIERAAETKSEFFDGEMFAMAGTTKNHARIVMNLSRELSARLKGR